MAEKQGKSSSSGKQERLRALRQFTLADIRKATKNFDPALIIRRGGYGEVYKGSYFDYIGGKEKIPKTVAVKCFNSKAWRPSFEWIEVEMEVWAQFYLHKYIVPVIGYCLESGYNIIIYEYMSSGSLANQLGMKTSSSSFLLSGKQCIDICIDAARGLESMHTRIRYSTSGGTFFHDDVTATNILLDENGIAKLTDLYKEPFGTKYICFFPQEYQTDSIFLSAEVYTFGLLLVKILCRKVSFDMEDQNLGIWFQHWIMDGTINQIIHPDMKAEMPPDRLKAILHIVDECLHSNPGKRPKITDVVDKLESAMASNSPRRSCHRFSFDEIKEATNNFENLLGEGGEGKVYRGEARTNIPIAVKLLKPEHSSAFEKEIEMLSTLVHPNLVSLVGYCHESGQKILIYEFMCNGNLQTTMRTTSLSWEQRLNICIGAARGLRHLHTGTKESPKGIIHRDMKPSNILLDENFDAKISDFGLSKMSFQDQTKSEIDTMLKGTNGYYAPEYHQNRQITRRIDVYAFGVILHEVLCGKKPWDREYSFGPTENAEYSIWAKENVDPHLEGAIAPSCLEAFADILEKCLDLKPKRRPNMNEVVSVLENALKWQEAWVKNDSGLLFYLPGCEDRVVLYYTSNYTEEATETFQECLRVRLFLRRFRVAIDERNPTKVIYAKEYKHVFGNKNKLRLPKVFVRGKYVGGIEILDKTEELAKLLGVACPRFICKDCGEERTCEVCRREEWYMLCKNCDALTIVSEDRKEDMRSCLECNGNTLIYKANLETL